MKSRLILITIISSLSIFSFITVVYGQGVIENGQPVCKGSYTEGCGEGKTRSVTCGPNGEFITGSCEGGDDSDNKECPVATIWDGEKCRGTAEGTSKETQEQDPVENGGETVAPREDEPEVISRQEGNERRVAGSGGGGAGGGNATSTPTPTADVSETCEDGQEKCWIVRDNSCSFGSCLVEGACSFINGTVSDDRPEQCTEESTTDDSVDPGSINPVDYRNTCSLACPDTSTQINTAVVPSDSSYILCYLDNGEDYSVRSGESTQCPSGQPTTITPEVDIPVNFPLCNGVTMTQSAPTDAGTILSADGTCIQEDGEIYHYCSGPYSQQGGTYNCGSDEPNSPTPTTEPEDDPSGSSLRECSEYDPDLYSCQGVSRKEANCQITGSNSVFYNYCQLNVRGAATERLTSGIYQITGDGIESTTIVISSENVRINFFVDVNGDGTQQDSEPDIDGSIINIQIEENESSSVYNLNAGWNLIGFDMISSDWQTASALMDEFDSQNFFVTHISTYIEGKWLTFSRREENGQIVDFGNDFSILPGKSYFIKAQDAGSIILNGNKFTSPVPVNISNGWNLVSIQSQTNYTASSLLNRCVAGGIQCNSIARFDSGLYDVVVSEQGTFFGNDFNIISKSGYFLRVASGGGQRLTP